MVFPETGKVDIRQFIWFRVVVNLKEDAKKKTALQGGLS